MKSWLNVLWVHKQSLFGLMSNLNIIVGRYPDCQGEELEEKENLSVLCELIRPDIGIYEISSAYGKQDQGGPENVSADSPVGFMEKLLKKFGNGFIRRPAGFFRQRGSFILFYRDSRPSGFSEWF